jgi:hypothetical protein
VCAELLEFAGDYQPLFEVVSAPESVAHVGFYNHPEVGSGGFHDLFHTQAHEAHPVFERPAVLVAAAVRVGREELADEVAMAGMDFNAVHTGVARHAHCVAE